MTKTDPAQQPAPAANPTREARLAKALRENLRRRKAPPTGDEAKAED